MNVWAFDVSSYWRAQGRRYQIPILGGSCDASKGPDMVHCAKEVEVELHDLIDFMYATTLADDDKKEYRTECPQAVAHGWPKIQFQVVHASNISTSPVGSNHVSPLVLASS
jgi:hypothetical protein